MRHRLQRAESFLASSPTSRYGTRSETPHSRQQSLTNLLGRQSDRRCGRRKAKIKHPKCRGTRASRLTRTRRRLRDCRPRPSTVPRDQTKGQAFRLGSLRTRQVKLSETPAVSGCSGAVGDAPTTFLISGRRYHVSAIRGRASVPTAVGAIRYRRVPMRSARAMKNEATNAPDTEGRAL
jgi:hypothetical protein